MNPLELLENWSKEAMFLSKAFGIPEHYKIDKRVFNQIFLGDYSTAPEETIVMGVEDSGYEETLPYRFINGRLGQFEFWHSYSGNCGSFQVSILEGDKIIEFAAYDSFRTLWEDESGVCLERLMQWLYIAGEDEIFNAIKSQSKFDFSSHQIMEWELERKKLFAYSSNKCSAATQEKS